MTVTTQPLTIRSKISTRMPSKWGDFEAIGFEWERMNGHRKIETALALILGDNEISAGTYLLKDMASGEQISLAREQLVPHVKEHGIRTS